MDTNFTKKFSILGGNEAISICSPSMLIYHLTQRLWIIGDISNFKVIEKDDYPPFLESDVSPVKTRLALSRLNHLYKIM